MPLDLQREAIREALRAWGIASVNRWCFSRGDRSIHVLEQARDLAPGTKENALRDLVGRDGTDRRRLMAAGIPWEKRGKRMDIVPTWACDPIRAANDADHPHERPEIAVDQGIPEDLRWVEQMVGQMGRQFPLRALLELSRERPAQCAAVPDVSRGAVRRLVFVVEARLGQEDVTPFTLDSPGRSLRLSSSTNASSNSALRREGVDAIASALISGASCSSRSASPRDFES